MQQLDQHHQDNPCKRVAHLSHAGHGLASLKACMCAHKCASQLRFHALLAKDPMPWARSGNICAMAADYQNFGNAAHSDLSTITPGDQDLITVLVLLAGSIRLADPQHPAYSCP